MLNRLGQRVLIHRQTVVTRLTHWVWTICLFFLLLTGLQIFNAHPVLYIGDQSGFAFDNSILRIDTAEGQGFVDLFGWRFVTTGLLGLSDNDARAFPAWATIPSHIDLATGRIIHFFFAWVFVLTVAIWFAGAVVSGHIRHDLVMRARHWRTLGSDLRDHLRFRFRHPARYAPLQRLSYGFVLFVLFPLTIATGLAMSPALNTAFPWLPEVLGGRQTARSLHFAAAFSLVLFFVVHVLMVAVSGPFNELRAIVTGWYMADANGDGDDRD